jgi:hypothetical protein
MTNAAFACRDTSAENKMVMQISQVPTRAFEKFDTFFVDDRLANPPAELLDELPVPLQLSLRGIYHRPDNRR